MIESTVKRLDSSQAACEQRWRDRAEKAALEDGNKEYFLFCMRFVPETEVLNLDIPQTPPLDAGPTWQVKDNRK